MLYTPCKDCSGTEYINIILTENQTDPAIPVASIPVTLTVTVTNKNDHPVMFLTQYGESILHQDPSEPVIVSFYLRVIQFITTLQLGKGGKRDVCYLVVTVIIEKPASI